MIWVWLVAGCADGAGKDDSGVSAGDWGTIVADRAGETAHLAAGAGWGFDAPNNGKAALYFAANAALSCEEVAVALGGPEDPEWERDAFLPPETCAVFAFLTYDPATGGAWTEADGVDATISVSCAMDPGTWEQSDACMGSYCYTGHYWQGRPEDLDLAVTGGAGEPYAVSLRMDGYQGQFTYETMDAAPASGLVTAETSAGWCSELGQTSWFTQ